VANVDRPFGEAWDMKMEISHFCAMPVTERPAYPAEPCDYL